MTPLRSLLLTTCFLGPLCCATTVVSAQIQIRRERVTQYHSASEQILRARIENVLARDVLLYTEYEAFVRELTGLGQVAASHLLDMVGHRVDDAYVTEALLRLGGPAVRNWVESILADPEAQIRHLLLTGVPSAGVVAPELRSRLAELLGDISPNVRALAVQRLFTAVPARRVIEIGHDTDAEVQQAALRVISNRWDELDHRHQEVENLSHFVSILESRHVDPSWDIGRSFLLAASRRPVADTEPGRRIQERIARLPWFLGEGPRARSGLIVDTVLARLRSAESDRVTPLAEVLAKASIAEGRELLLRLVDEKDPALRLAACAAGRRLLDPDLAAAYVGFLRDEDDRVRASAREVLDQTAYLADQRRRWLAAARR